VKFDLSDDQALLRDSTRDFLHNESPLETSRQIMEHDARGYDAAVWMRLAEMGYLSLLTPTAAGGQGLGAVELAVVLEEMGRVCFPGPYLDVVLAAHLLAGADANHPLVGAITNGSSLVTIARQDTAFSGASAPAVAITHAHARGVKHFVPFAEHADALLVVVDDGVVFCRSPFAVTPMPTFDPAQRFCKVTFDHPATPAATLEGLRLTDQLAAIGASAMLLGIMSRALDVTLGYVQTRHTFKRPIGAFQALQHRLADMLLKVESTRSAVYRAAWCFDAHDPDAHLATAVAKAYAGDASRLVCGEAIQMHGGIGFTWELDLHFLFKRAKTLEQHYGSTEEQLERALAATAY